MFDAAVLVCERRALLAGQEAAPPEAAWRLLSLPRLPSARPSRGAPEIFPDYSAPIVRNQPEGRELMMARWGMPSLLVQADASSRLDRASRSIKMTLAADELFLVKKGQGGEK